MPDIWDNENNELNNIIVKYKEQLEQEQPAAENKKPGHAL